MITHITFKALNFSDIPLMHRWFNLPHIQLFYSLREWTEDEVLLKLKPYINGEKPVTGLIVLTDDEPIGYLQYYKVKDYPWPNQTLSEEIIENAAGAYSDASGSLIPSDVDHYSEVSGSVIPNDVDHLQPKI